MKKAFSLKYSIETLCVLFTVVLGAAVLHQFVIGKHFIIPTVILIPTLLFLNLARGGYRDQTWAKYTNFWLGVVLTAHWFFAIFFSQTLKAKLGIVFEPLAVAICLFLGYLTLMYRRHNQLDV